LGKPSARRSDFPFPSPGGFPFPLRLHIQLRSWVLCFALFGSFLCPLRFFHQGSSSWGRDLHVIFSSPRLFEGPNRPILFLSGDYSKLVTRSPLNPSPPFCTAPARRDDFGAPVGRRLSLCLVSVTNVFKSDPDSRAVSKPPFMMGYLLFSFFFHPHSFLPLSVINIAPSKTFHAVLIWLTRPRLLIYRFFFYFRTRLFLVGRLIGFLTFPPQILWW